MPRKKTSDSEVRARPRGVGRPRLQPRNADVDPTDEILAVASRLFGALGIGATSMARIAADAGLAQSSLYYYFHSKEEVLAAIVGRANVVPLELVRRIEADGGPPAVRLYRFVRGDVLALCRMPFDINEVHRYSARDRERFAQYWDERKVLRRRIAAIVRDGIDDKAFRDVDPSTAALTVMSNDEAVQNWYRVEGDRRRGAVAAAVFVADLTVGGLLREGVSLDAVRAEADLLDAD
ncbi:MAG TPA: TetR/AcrR family transcriptional regulator [Acidimicrobiia bacterium]|nr:TetR/AcrR family transcriptional regulator [Acidimicrobiia bacterium]